MDVYGDINLVGHVIEFHKEFYGTIDNKFKWDESSTFLFLTSTSFYQRKVTEETHRGPPNYWYILTTKSSKHRCAGRCPYDHFPHHMSCIVTYCQIGLMLWSLALFCFRKVPEFYLFVIYIVPLTNFSFMHKEALPFPVKGCIQTNALYSWLLRSGGSSACHT